MEQLANVHPVGLRAQAMSTVNNRAAGDSTLKNVLSHKQTKAGRVGRRVVLGLLGLFIVVALLQFFDSDTSRTVSASGDGYNVTVNYSPTGRAGLASSLTIRVEGGQPITAPITIALSETYLDGFSVQDVSPEAASEGHADGLVELDYDPPNKQEFTVHLRGAWQSGNAASASGSVVVSVDGHVVAAVPLDSWLVP